MLRSTTRVLFSGVPDEEEVPSQTRKQLKFTPFTPDSYQELLRRDEKEKQKELRKKSRWQEAHLKDGELMFGDEEETEKQPERNPDLDEGKYLKAQYGEPPVYFMGLPLEEFDKGVSEKTFVVLSQWLNNISISRFSATPAFFLLPPWNPVRRVAVYLCTNQFFDFFILLTILTNCIILAIPEVNDVPWVEFLFFAIYSTEMMIRIMARGLFFSSYTYLRDPWNWLDMIVVLSGLPSIILTASQISSKSKISSTQVLRTFRVLRAVKTISIFPGLRTIVNAMLRAVKMLGQVVLLTVFCLLFMSLVSVQIYKGTLRQKCVFDPALLTHRQKTWETYDEFYIRMLRDPSNWQQNQNGYVLCGNATGAGGCKTNYTCQPNLGENPNYGFMNFDNILWSALITFQLMTIDFWENAYRKVLLTNGVLTAIFFLLTVFFGSFYLLNLMLAVVTITYEEEAVKTTKELESEKASTRQRKEAVNAFYNISMLASKQNVWAQLVHENKSKDKDKEHPFIKAMRLRAVLNDWRKRGALFAMYANPEVIAHFEQFASETRTAKEITRNVANCFQKWRRASRKKQLLAEPPGRIPARKLIKESNPGQVSVVPPWKHRDSLTRSGSDTKDGGISRSKSRVTSFGGSSTSNWQSFGKRPQFIAGSTLRVKSESSGELRDFSRHNKNPLKVRRGLQSTGGQHYTGKSETSRLSDHKQRQTACVDQVDPLHTQPPVGINVQHEDDVINRPQIVVDEVLSQKQNTEDGESRGEDISPLRSGMSLTGPEDGLSSAVLQPDIRVQAPDQQSGNSSVRSRRMNPMSAISRLSERSSGLLKYLSPSIRMLASFGSSHSVQRTDSGEEKEYFFCSSIKSRCAKIRTMITAMVSDIFFDLFINLCIVISTINMSLEYHGMPYSLRTVIVYSSFLFTGLFDIEAALKLIGLGFSEYFRGSWNRFDFAIAVLSTASVVLERFDVTGTDFLRAFRLLRVLKLAKVWPAMNDLLAIIGNALSALGQLTIILTIILYIFSIIGMHLFNHKYQKIYFPGGVPRWNFSDFFHSFMMMFRVLCGEWIEALWDCMRIRDVHNGTCMIVFFPTLILGNFVVLNLFLALLLSAFGENTNRSVYNEEAARLTEAKYRLKRAFRRLFYTCCRRKPVLVATHWLYPNRTSQDSGDSRKTEDQLTGAKVASDSTEIMKETAKDRMVYAEHEESQTSKGTFIWGELVEPPPCLPSCLLRRLLVLCKNGSMAHFHHSQFGRRWLRFRATVLKFINNDIFEYAILFFILGSSVMLIFEDYNYRHPKDYSLKKKMEIFFWYTDTIFTWLFTVEMLLRWSAYGINRYFTSAWTILDFIVVVVSLVTWVSDLLNVTTLKHIRALRALRAFRPVRIISRVQGMRIVVNSLMRAIPAILNVFLVSMVFWLIFSVMGVQFFSGKFYKCVTKSNRNKVSASLVKTKADCLRLGPQYVWFNSYVNFDNVGSGFLALFQVATFEGWMEVMRDAVDSTEVDKQPVFENSFHTYWYFVAFIICGSFISLNLVIGVIIDNFNVLKKKYEGSYLDAFLTLNQRNYYNTLKKMANRRPQRIITPPRSSFQKVFYNLSVSDRFELILMGMVILNMVVMAVECHLYKIPCSWTEVLAIMEVAFTTFFALECVLKIIGLRLYYFTIPWNCYDFLVAVLCVCDLGFYVITTYVRGMDRKIEAFINGLFFPPTFLRLLRMFRISRVFRVIKVAKGLRKVIFSLVISLPAIVNIMALLMLCIFFYAILGMFLFSEVKLKGALTATMNFRTFQSSALLLLSLSTAAAWNDILDALLIAPPFCNDTHHEMQNGLFVTVSGGDCGSYMLAVAYMVSYIIITYLFIINMYIAVILENYNQAHQEEEVGVTEDDFDMFYSVWQRYDPHASQFINYADLSDLVADLDKPLGIDKPNEIALVSLNLPILHANRVHCLDVLFALVKNVLNQSSETEDMATLKKQVSVKFRQRFPSRAAMTVVSSTILRKKEDVAARTLQRAWQVHKTRQAIHSLMKMARKQAHARHNSVYPANAWALSELSHNMATACITYFDKLMTGRPQPEISSKRRHGVHDAVFLTSDHLSRSLSSADSSSAQ